MRGLNQSMPSHKEIDVSMRNGILRLWLGHLGSSAHLIESSNLLGLNSDCVPSQRFTNIWMPPLRASLIIQISTWTGHLISFGLALPSMNSIPMFFAMMFVQTLAQSERSAMSMAQACHDEPEETEIPNAVRFWGAGCTAREPS